MPDPIQRNTVSIIAIYLIACSLISYLYLSHIVNSLSLYEGPGFDKAWSWFGIDIGFTVIIVGSSMLIGRLCERLMRSYSGVNQFVVSSIALTIIVAAIIFLMLSIAPEYAGKPTFNFAVIWSWIAWQSALLSFLLSFLYFTLMAGKTWSLSSLLGPYDSNKLSHGFDTEKFLVGSGLPEKTVTDIVDLHRRSDVFMDKARSVLVIMIFVLLSAALFVVFAERILAFGTSQIQPLGDTERERNEYQIKIENIRGELVIVKADLGVVEDRLARAEGGVNEIQPSEAERAVDAASLRLEIHKLRAIVIQKTDQMKYYLERQSTLDKWVDAAREKIQVSIIEGGEDEGANVLRRFTDTRLLIAALVARLGVAALAIYLVQMLMHLYRYNTQVAAHYRAQADSLMFAKVESESIAELYEVFLPDVRYGKMPRTVAEEAARGASGGWLFGRGRRYKTDSEGS